VLVVCPCAAARAAAPRLAIDEAVFDFGAVDRGTRVEHTFALRNAGDAPLRIEAVKSSCGCTVTLVSARDVPPGETGRLSVSVDTTRMTGRATKTVTVHTNDPDAPASGLTVTGEVRADLVVTPSPLYLGRVRRGESTHHEVHVRPGRPEAVYSVTVVEHDHPALRARLERRTDQPEQWIVIEVDPDAPPGHFDERLTLHTTSAREPLITLSVFGSIEGDVVVLPPHVTFGVARGGASPKRELSIRNRGVRPVTVTGVSVPREIATYDLRAVRKGREYRLTLRLRPGLPPGKVEGAVEIFTDHPDEARLVVPLYAIVHGGRGRG
jgi:hypothetical protein